MRVDKRSRRMSASPLSFLLIALLAGSALSWGQTARYEPQPIPGPENTERTAAPPWLMPLKDLDEQLPGWLALDGEYRSRVEEAGHRNYKEPSDTYLLSQLRFWLTLKPVSWLTVVGETQDSRVFFNQLIPSAGPYQNTWDIRQAYVQLGNATEGWWDVTAGRQIFSFGEERLIGPSDWLNMGRTFDAVRLDLHHTKNEVSLFASSVIVARDGVVDHHLEGNNFHGAYGSFKTLIPRATVEPYVLWRVAPPNIHLSENAGLGRLNEVTAGIHLTGKLPAQFDYGTEMVKQTGSLGPYSIHAWAGHWILGKTFESAAVRPRVFVESNYASGTRDPNSRSWGTFDQLYPSSHDKLGFADQVGWRNIEQVRGGVEEKFGKKWRVKQTYESFWLANVKDGLYTSSGSLAVKAPAVAAGRHVGQELDVNLIYDYDQAITAGFGYAHLFTGQFLRRTTPGRNYEYPYVYLEYRF